MIRSHGPDSQFDAGRPVRMFRDDGGGLGRARIPQIHELFRKRRVEPHERDVDESQDIREATIQHRSPEFRKVRVARTTRVHRRGNAVIQAHQRIYAI